MKLSSATCTHIGRRDNNEDALVCEPGLGLYAVADGMGGYEGGEVASRLAVEALTEFVRRNAGDADLTWPYPFDRSLTPDENMAHVAARIANDGISARRCGPLRQMGATLAMVIVRGGEAVIAHVGDSRVYRWRGGFLQQLTRDHSAYEELLAAGIEVPPREEFPHSNMITRALGIGGLAEVRTESLCAGDLYVICSDGLSDVVPSEVLAAHLAARSTDLDRTARGLVTEAYDRGGRDNITVVLVEVGV
jgi:serine/threonine protein phosphatase PrpC